jgi:hypothetical protein
MSSVSISIFDSLNDKIEIMIPHFLFRVLIPSWRFFDHADALAKLHVRQKDAGGAWDEWRPLLRPDPESVVNFFCNANGNLQHAKCNLLDRLVQEISEQQNSDHISLLVSYQMMRLLVYQELQEVAHAFQFKISVNRDSQDLDMFLSEEFRST